MILAANMPSSLVLFYDRKVFRSKTNHIFRIDTKALTDESFLVLKSTWDVDNERKIEPGCTQGSSKCGIMYLIFLSQLGKSRQV